MTSLTESRVWAIIIDSARGTRRLDNAQSSPSSLKTVESSRTVLDWIIHALACCGSDKVTYVGGYHIQKVIERYPTLAYRFQADWQERGEVESLRLARPDSPGDCLIIRVSTICVPEAIQRLTHPLDSASAGYYSDGSEQKFVGLIALPEAQVEAAFAIADSISLSDPRSDLEAWLSAMQREGLPVRQIDLDALAAPLHDPVAVARTIFGGKGRTLEQVQPLLKNAVVLEQVRFRAEEWLENPAPIITEIQEVFADRRVVVRSSTSSEDGLDESSAGRFSSVLNVPAGQVDCLCKSVDEVIESYSSEGRVSHSMDEVLVQPHIGELAASGVLFTRDIETGAPYYVLNIDRSSGRSDSVTSGAEVGVETLYVSRMSDFANLDDDVRACVILGRELEELTHLDALDIEFGIDRAGNLYLFQVRPIARRARKFQLADQDLIEELARVGEFLDAHMHPHPTLAGDTTVLGTMPDWNPAEMIGTAPRPLALTLYQRLIGDKAWAEARALIGYRDVRPEPLIVSLCGRPYVDVRASLNSFLPGDIDSCTAEAWVNHCIRMLHQDSRLHDKIEFDVAITCLAFDFDDQAQRLRAAGLDDESIKEFRRQLLRLTDAILTEKVSPIESQLAMLNELARRRTNWINDDASDMASLSRRINVLLADCERYGVVPFSVLARYAFISMSLLRSLVKAGILSDDVHESLLNSIPTVASDLSRDLQQHALRDLSIDELLERYGHLRPSSYDITSPNYANARETYFSSLSRSSTERAYPDVSVARAIFDEQADQINSLMQASGFTATVDQLASLVLRSIPGREWAKFEFMKSVDAALEAIAELGEELGFSRDEMSFLPIDLVIRGAKDSANSAVRTEFRRTVEFNKKRWDLTCAARLPHLVRSKDEVAAFQLEEWTPNFISTSRVVAPLAFLDAGLPPESLDGRIVIIRAADPGYDWIFSHPIAGLITEFGGVASHMAIRAAEFGLPAAIGCGELIFERLCDARLVELDCASKKVRAIS
jgi:hypothetical protein